MRIFRIVFILLLIFSNANSKLNPFFHKEITEVDENGNKIAYKIFVPGKKLPDGKYALGKVYNVPVLDEKYLVKNSVYVKFKRNLSYSERKSIIPLMLSTAGFELQAKNIEAPYEEFQLPKFRKFDTEGISRIYRIQYSGDENIYKICKNLMENPEIEYAIPEYINEVTDYTPNDPKAGSQWALSNIEAFASWDISQGDSSIVIAITDSGVEYTHEDLKDNIWYNPNEIPNNNKDDDNNGYIDDYIGWDFVGNVSYSQAASGQYKEDNDPKPGFWHGTHVAGCAAEVGDNGKGGIGPGFKCKIMALKCGIDQTSSISIFRGYDAILYAAQNGAKVINCSWGGPGGSPVEQEIINTATNLGSVVVVSAGNSYKNIDYGNFYPAGYDNVLCVGAIRSNNRKAGFSNYGHMVTVYAPGENIYATMTNNKYGNQSGTSMAGPIVAGICGQLINVHPDWTPKQIIHQIRSTSVPTAESQNLRPIYYGRVNAKNALSYNNANLGTYDKIPGLEISKIIGSVSVLTNFEETSFQMEVTNYLARSYRTKITITPLSKYISVSTDYVNLGTLQEGESKTFELKVQLKEFIPWYEGLVDVLIQFESDDYIDYQLIQFPVKLETNNKWALNLVVPEEILPQWYSATSTNYNDLIVVGASANTGNGIIYKNGSAYNPNGLTQYPIYCVNTKDGNLIYAATGGNKTEIIKSTNGGFNWSSIEVSEYTNFINGLYFFDNLEGIAFGDPKQNIWGVIKTTNGGQTWGKIYNIPEPLSGEAGFLNCTFGYGNRIWFGTNKGRIFISKDRGKNWQTKTLISNGFIHYIYFFDENSGLLLYSEANSSDIKVAFTADGGVNWNINVFNFSQYGVQPFYLYSAENSKTVFAVCRGGEIFSSRDYGKTWNAILNYKFSSINFATIFAASGEGKLWAGETEIWSLEFEYLPDNPHKILSLDPSQTLDFGDIEAGKSSSKTIIVKNDGNMTIHIDSVIIKPAEGVYDDEFNITFPLSSEISAGESKTMRIRFNPQKGGFRQANLLIYSDADEKNKSLLLQGNSTGAYKEITFIPDSILIMDTTEIGKSSEKIIKLKNSGNVITIIDEITLDNIQELSIEADSNFELKAGKTADIKIKFEPQTIGEKTAILNVTYDEGEVHLGIYAVAIEPVSVDNLKENFELSELIPNPAGDNIYFVINSYFPVLADIQVINMEGIVMNKYHFSLYQGKNSIKIPVNHLVNGNYVVRIKIGDQVFIKKLIMNN